MRFKNIYKIIPILIITAVLSAGCGKASLSGDDFTKNTAAETVTETSSSKTDNASKKTSSAVSPDNNPDKKTDSQKNTDSSTSAEEAKNDQYSSDNRSDNSASEPAVSSGSAGGSGSSGEGNSQVDKGTDNHVNNQTAGNSPSAPVSSSESSSAETQTETSSLSRCSVTVDGGGSEGIYFSGELEFEGSASVYDILCMTGVSITGSSSYISAINSLAEKEHGPMSGWLYTVNGNMQMISCGSCFISDGDSICWYYQYDE